MLDVEYVTREQIIEANKIITRTYGDPFGVLSEANLDHAVTSIQYKYNKEDEFEAMALKAALLLDLMANKGHIFVEGNKRTALSVCVTFLEANGFTVETGKEEEKFVLSVARNEQSVTSISKWLKGKIVKLQRT